jgi:hypothetical protein
MKCVKHVKKDDHQIWLYRDHDRDEYLVEAVVKEPGAIRHLVERVKVNPTNAEIIARCKKRGVLSPRPYRLAQPCDGSITGPVMALFAHYCAVRGLGPVTLMIQAYPDEAGDWTEEDFARSKADAEWEGVAYPSQWNDVAVRGLLDSLGEVNYHSLACVVEDLESTRVNAPCPGSQPAFCW